MPVTMQDIARRAGVTKQTVSKILNNTTTRVSISEKTRKRVLGLVGELNYRPNRFAQSLKTGRTHIIGVTTLGVPYGHFGNSYAAQIYSALGDFFTRHNYKLIFQDQKQLQDSSPALDLAQRRMVDGIIYLLFSRELDHFKKAILSQIKAQHTPFVVIHSLREQLPCFNIGVDCFAGAYTATRHLLDHRYNEIGCVGTKYPPHCADLVRGYEQALKEQGKKALIFPIRQSSFDEGYRVAERMLKYGKVPRALLAVDDTIAFGMMKKFREAGVEVPEQVALVGFSDTVNEEISGLADLTSIKQPVEEKGEKAGEMLMRQMENPGKKLKPRSITLTPALTIRGSCGCGQ